MTDIMLLQEQHYNDSDHDASSKETSEAEDTGSDAASGERILEGQAAEGDATSAEHTSEGEDAAGGAISADESGGDLLSLGDAGVQVRSTAAIAAVHLAAEGCNLSEHIMIMCC